MIYREKTFILAWGDKEEIDGDKIPLDGSLTDGNNGPNISLETVRDENP